jgi:hypothetical protein
MRRLARDLRSIQPFGITVKRLQTSKVNIPMDPPYGYSKIVEARSWQVIQDAAPEDIIVLYRGCNQTDANKMRDKMSAGGRNLDEKCGVPSEAEIIAQVGEGQYTLVNGTYVKSKLPEFTHDSSKVMMRRVKVPVGVIMGVVKIWIRRRYIVRGDAGAMEGWCAKYEAPIERWEWFPYTPSH